MLPHKDTAAGIVIRGDQGQPVTTSTAIALGTEVQHKNVLELVRRYLVDLEKFGAVPFKTEARSDGSHGGGAVYAVLNEQQATLLIAFMRNSTLVVDFKVALVRSFYEMRAALQTPASVKAPGTMREALILALAQAEQIDQLESKISADAPKVEFAETIRALDGVCSIEKIAKTLGIGRNKFFGRLRDDGVLLSNNLPYQKYIDREYFTVVEGAPYIDSKKVSHPTFTTMVTGAGQVYLARKYGAQPLAIIGARAATIAAESAL